jgi:hypothetical protein
MILDIHRICWIRVVSWSNEILLAGAIWELAGALINIQRSVGVQRQKDQCKSKFIFSVGLESRFIFSVHLEYRFMSSVHQESWLISTFIRNPSSCVNHKSCSLKLSIMHAFATKYVVVGRRAAWTLEACPAAITIVWRQGPMWRGSLIRNFSHLDASLESVSEQCWQQSWSLVRRNRGCTRIF